MSLLQANPAVLNQSNCKKVGLRDRVRFQFEMCMTNDVPHPRNHFTGVIRFSFQKYAALPFPIFQGRRCAKQEIVTFFEKRCAPHDSPKVCALEGILA